jgi:hypothetical protein
MIRALNLNRNQSFLGFIALLIFSAVLLSLNFLYIFPDYSAYQYLFNVRHKIDFSYDNLFILLAYFFNLAVSEDYKSFRIFILCIQFFLILIIQKNSYKLRVKNIQSNLFTLPLLIFYCFTAGFMFFSLQIRDGLALLLLFSGIIFLINKSYKFSLLYLILSFLTHNMLFLAFSIFLLPALIQAKVITSNKILIIPPIYINIIIGFISCLIFVYIFLWQFTYVFNLRSSMNVYRLFFYFL